MLGVSEGTIQPVLTKATEVILWKDSMLSRSYSEHRGTTSIRWFTDRAAKILLLVFNRVICLRLNAGQQLAQI